MRAIVQDQYGPLEVLRLRELERPAVSDDEVLVRVHAASVHPDVWHAVHGRPYVLRLMGGGLRRPRSPIPGIDLAGRVSAVGRAASRFQPGDEVFGESVRGHQWRNGGAFAEYAAVPEDTLARKPARLTYEQAAAVPTSGLIALQNLPQQSVEPGHRVLVNGAAGGVGTIALQLAKAYGATVTGVDRTEKLDLVRSLGADHVVDYTREDFTRGGERYDLIFDVPAGRPFAELRRALTPEGRYVPIGHDDFGRVHSRWLGGLPHMLALMARAPFTRQLPGLTGSTPSKRELLATLAELLESGKVTPVVDRTYPLAEAADALRYLASGQASGKVVLAV